MRQQWLDYTQAVSAQIKFGCINLPTGEICYWHSQNYVKGHLRHSYSDADQIWFDLRQAECRGRSIPALGQKTFPTSLPCSLVTNSTVSLWQSKVKLILLKSSPAMLYITWVYLIPHWTRNSVYQVPTLSWILEIPVLEAILKAPFPRLQLLCFCLLSWDYFNLTWNRPCLKWNKGVNTGGLYEVCSFELKTDLTFSAKTFWCR